MATEMTIRFTLAEKWQDKWFRSLSPAEKLLFLYIIDNCNIAGIWEIDTELASFVIGMTIEETQKALEKIKEKTEPLNETHLWIRNFLKHQRNLPLKINNAAHVAVINILLEYKDCSNNILRLLDTEDIREATRGYTSPCISPLNSPHSISNSKSTSKSKGNSNSKFVPPTFLEVKEYIESNPELSNVNAETFFKGFNDSGWVDTQGKPVKNWKLKLRTWSSYGQRSRPNTDERAKPAGNYIR
ncbi:MAG: hypothetical protein M0R34_00440 [Candidatus Marinimicrobia bacterium]|nr:hypothetical protein [Candidatus Neomarinimicrobiota bacterium]